MKLLQFSFLVCLFFSSIRMDAQISNAVAPPNMNDVACGSSFSIANDFAEFMALGGTATTACADQTISVFAFIGSGGTGCPGDPQTSNIFYTLSDNCGSSVQVTQTIVFEESTLPPVITSVLLTQTINCETQANPQVTDITFDVDSGCGISANGVNISGPTSIDLSPGCPNILRYTYTAMDNCNRLSAPVTRDFIIGPPVITNFPPNIAAPAKVTLSITDFIPLVSEIASNLIVDVACGNTYTLTNNYTNQSVGDMVRFTATDSCGRISFIDLEIVASPLSPIPTMSQWGLLIFGLLVLNLGVSFVYRQERLV